MYTQCPKCLTYFQVTAEHLKVAQGNVRCGQCSNVFSALGNLSEVPPQQNKAQAKSQGNNSGSNAGQNSAADAGAPGDDAQSKLTNAIAAIQALNQSSQQILSQGRKNYVTQLQKQAQAKRKFNSSNANDATARALDSDDLESASAHTARSDADIDIEEAIAAVEGIGFDDDDLPIQYGATDDEDITPAFDGSHLVEDYKNEDSSTGENNSGKNTRAKILKTEAIDDDVFDFSELDLPDQDERDTKQNKSGKPGKKTKTKKQSKTKKKLSQKKSVKSGGASAKSVTPERTAHRQAEVEIRSREYTNEQRVTTPQHIVSDPDVIIENNIPTLAIPKALLEDFEREKVSQVNYRSMLTWGSLSVLMMLVFLGQAIYFKHNELGQISQLRPWVQMFCKHASCELSMQADIGKIELLGQDIRTHPKSGKALLVSATIINNASFTQPYPGLQLSFSDINGVKVATRNFLPKDYLPSKFTRRKGMESNIPIQLELELVDPGKSAVNFEFDFFSI